MRCTRRGLTLVEVVASLLLLSTLLVAVLAACGGQARQIRQAQRRLEAVSAADRLLVDWLSGPERFPRNTSGNVPENHALTWRTRLMETAGTDKLGIEVARLEILDEELAKKSRLLVSVDVVLPAPQPEAENEAGHGPPTAPVEGGGHPP